MTRLCFETLYGSVERSPYVVERRVGGSAPVSLYELAQARGDHSDPPLDDLVIAFSKTAHRLSYTADDVRYSGRLEPGAVGVTPPGMGQHILLDDANAFLVLSIPGERARALLEELRPGKDPFSFGRLRHSKVKSYHAQRLVETLWTSAELRPSQMYCDAVTLTLLGELCTESDAAPHSQRGGLAPWQERRCTDYLRDKVAEDVDLPTLAAMANLSPFHFARMFKKSVGVPPHRYQLLLRLERAKDLLVATEMSVIHVALAVGYDSPQTLARLFQRELGMTPSQYRRERPT